MTTSLNCPEILKTFHGEPLYGSDSLENIIKWKTMSNLKPFTYKAENFQRKFIFCVNPSIGISVRRRVGKLHTVTITHVTIDDALSMDVPCDFNTV